MQNHDYGWGAIGEAITITKEQSQRAQASTKKSGTLSDAALFKVEEALSLAFGSFTDGVADEATHLEGIV